MFLEYLGRCWSTIILADDGDVQSLPAVEIGRPNDLGLLLPQLHEPQGSQHLRFGSGQSWTSGPPGDPAEQFKALVDDPADLVHRLNTARKANVEAVLAAWKTTAFQWYGETFSTETMNLLYELDASRFNTWIGSTLADSELGSKVRVRLGALLEPICRVLLRRNLALGFDLWKWLHDDDEGSVRFDTLGLAFAEDSEMAMAARQILLDECANDADISEIAVAAEFWDRRSWLTGAVDEMVSAPPLWRRAKSLTLASFSDIAPADFERLVERAGVAESWVDLSLQILRSSGRKNHLARHWYRTFLTTADRDVAWGALQIVLANADRRFTCWREEIEMSCEDPALCSERLRFLNLRWRDRDRGDSDLDRSSQRRDRLLGMKIQKGELVPFM